MSRPREDGLRYFPFVTGFFKDKRIRRLRSRFGAEGPLFYVYILCEAYDNGYKVKYDDDFIEDAALDLGCTTDKIGLMLHYLLDKSLLDSTLFNTVKVLSSHGIQAQYQASKKGLKRDVEVDGNSWILDDSETEGFIKVRNNQDKSGRNSDKSGRNSDKSGRNHTKEIKGKESKIKENTATDKPPRHTHEDWGFGPELTAALEDWLRYKQEKRDGYKPTGMGALVTRVKNNVEKYGEAAVAGLIRDCMSANWKGIIWDKLGKQSPRKGVQQDYQPTQDRIQRNNDWLDDFLDKQKNKE